MRIKNVINKIGRLSTGIIFILFLSLISINLFYPGSAKAYGPDLNDDGIVNILDVSIVGSCFGQAPVGSCSSADCDNDGDIDYDDLYYVINWFGQPPPPPPTGITVEAGSDSIFIEVGSSLYAAFTVNFESDGSDIYHVTAVQEVIPDNGGISWSNDYPWGGWNPSGTMTYVINEEIFGHSVGNYELTKRATIAETGDTSEVTINVTVYEPVEEPEILPLGMEPGGVSVSTPTTVIFTTTIISPPEGLPPVEVVVERVDSLGNLLSTLGSLLDDGVGDDLENEDGIYTGTCTITENTAGLAYFRVRAEFNFLGTRYSSIADLLVTHLPTTTAPSNMEMIVTESSTGAEIISNEVLVSFEEGTDEGTIEGIVAAAGGTIVGSIPALGVYQVSIPDTGDDTGVNGAIAQLTTDPAVSTAEPNYIAETSEVTPNDPSYPLQWGLTKIRADEAWVIARGIIIPCNNALHVAIIDTGVDYNHPDLSGKVNTGADRDFINNDWDAMDDHSHGTHCAGIAMAKTNNSLGVAGVSWGCRILPIKVLSASGSGSYTAIADGVRYAADRGAKILSLSLGGTGYSTTLRNACIYAKNKGCLIVAAAGNNGHTTNSPNYPGAYPEVFCVAATDAADNRAWFSTYGSQVDISAPGVSIYSTILSNSYGYKSGTSMATPMVSGAAAVIWARNLSLTATNVRLAMEKTARDLSASGMGHGRLDLFEALFNGDFETTDLFRWSSVGTAATLTSLGPILPTHGDRMGYASTGPAGDNVAATVSQTFTIQSGVTTLPITLDYNFVSEEYPEWVGTPYNDALRITLVSPSGTHTIVYEDINNAAFVPVGGINFPGGDNTVGMTNWQTVHVNIPVTGGAGEYKLYVTDAGDDIYDTVVLIDNIRFK